MKRTLALLLLTLSGCAIFQPHVQKVGLNEAAQQIVSSTDAIVASARRYGATYGATSGGSEVGSFPNAAQLSGPERLLGDQNGNTVNITPAQIGQYLGIPNGLVFPLSVANGGNGTATPSLTAGANITITGTWPNYTIVGSGGGTPGGSGGQLQFNNSGAFGGFTLAGDCTLSQPDITCTTSGGIPIVTTTGTQTLTNKSISGNEINSGTVGLSYLPTIPYTQISGLGSLATTTPGTGVATALGVNVGSAGAVVVNGGALGTPSSGVGTNLTGTASALSIGGTAANLSGTPALPNGTTGTTQSVADNTTKLATDAFVIANAGSVTGANNTIALNNSGSTGALTPGTPQAAIGVLNSASANAQTGTTYTFVIGDANGEVTMSNASSNTVTIPPNSSVAFPVGTLLTVQEVSTGVTSVGPGTGVTITSAAYGSSTSQTYSLGGVYGFIQLQQTATNTWTVVSWDTPVGQQIRALAISSEMQAYLAASTAATMAPTGCTLSTVNNGPFAGSFTDAATCTSIVVSINGATGFTDSLGYHCDIYDQTQYNSGTYFGNWGAKATSSTTATLPIPVAVTVGDTVSWRCTPRSL